MVMTVRIQEDGPRNAVLWIDEDGASPAAGVVITPAQLGYIDTIRQLRARNLRIDKIEWDINGEATEWVELTWTGSGGGPAPAYHMIGRANKYFKDFGGLYPPVSVVPANGTLTNISIALSAAFAGTYTVILYLVKTQ